MLRRFYSHGPKMERARVQRPEGQGIKRPRSGTSQLDLVIESFEIGDMIQIPRP